MTDNSYSQEEARGMWSSQLQSWGPDANGRLRVPVAEAVAALVVHVAYEHDQCCETVRLVRALVETLYYPPLCTP